MLMPTLFQTITSYPIPKVLLKMIFLVPFGGISSLEGNTLGLEVVQVSNSKPNV